MGRAVSLHGNLSYYWRRHQHSIDYYCCLYNFHCISRKADGLNEYVKLAVLYLFLTGDLLILYNHPCWTLTDDWNEQTSDKVKHYGHPRQRTYITKGWISLSAIDFYSPTIQPRHLTAVVYHYTLVKLRVTPSTIGYWGKTLYPTCPICTIFTQ